MIYFYPQHLRAPTTFTRTRTHDLYPRVNATRNIYPYSLPFPFSQVGNVQGPHNSLQVLTSLHLFAAVSNFLQPLFGWNEMETTATQAYMKC